MFNPKACILIAKLHYQAMERYMNPALREVTV